MRRRILIIEDDEAIAENLETLLEEEGFCVTVVKNGQLGMDYLKMQATLPSLILLDLMMPVVDGWAFRKAQANDPNLNGIPVVMMTADGQTEANRARAGAVGFLRKPFNVYELLNAVERFAA